MTVEVTGESHGARRGTAPRQCVYVMTAQWRYGRPDPFCGAAALPGSSYCAEHRSLCEVDPASEEGRRLAVDQAEAAQAALPAEFPPLAAPEALQDLDPIDHDPSAALAELDRSAAGGTAPTDDLA